MSVMHFSDDYTDSEDPSETETESVESDPHTSDLEFIDDQSLLETSGSESDVDVSAEEMIVGNDELQLVFENVASGVVPSLDVNDTVVIKEEPVTPTVVVIEDTVEKGVENGEGLSGADAAGGEGEESDDEDDEDEEEEDEDEEEEEEEEDEEDEDEDEGDEDEDEDEGDEDEDEGGEDADEDDNEVRENAIKGVKRKRVSEQDPEFQAALLKIIKRAI